MTLRATRRALREGTLVLRESRSNGLSTQDVEAITTARLYLGGDERTEDLAEVLHVTPERVAQMIRRGIRVLTERGLLVPSTQCDSTPP